MRAYAAILVAAGLAYAAAVGSPATTETSLRGRLAPLWRVATWRDGLYYMATFGGFVAVTLLATDLYVEVHGLSLETAGAMATTFTLSSSLARVPGGWLADRLGGDHVLRVALGTIALSLAPLAMASSLLTTVCLVFVAGLAMGVGMAAVYQRIPGRFPTGVGAAGGAVGALGGLAGFYLPLVGSWAGSPLLPVGALAALALLTHIAWERPTR
jgi:NNP family nitrate/nitrite transporter-like MFS transporter